MDTLEPNFRALMTICRRNNKAAGLKQHISVVSQELSFNHLSYVSCLIVASLQKKTKFKEIYWEVVL